MERKFIIPKWEQKLLFLRQFIDDKFGIWLGTSNEFNSFIIDINSYCQLQWTSEGTSTSVNFLDLTISIGKNGNIITKTFQKPINLHLYIPPHSAHPPGVLKSIIYGNLRRYWLQNTNVEDYISIAKQFASCLTARGYNPNKIYNLFIQAANKLDKLVAAKQQNDNNNTIYLHWTWHPRDVSRTKLRLIFDKTLKEKSGYNNLIIAYSRARNLRDSLMKTSLSEPEGRNISNLLNQGIGRGN